MSLPAQNPSQSMVAIAAQTVFPFTFRCDDSTQIQAWVGDAQQGGIIVALNGDQVAAPGGTVTLAPQAAGAVVTVERVNPQTQTLALTAYNPYTAAAITLALDKVVELLQEFWALVARVPRITRANRLSMDNFDMPAPVVGASIGWAQTLAGKFYLSNIGAGGAGPGGSNVVTGERLVDTGDHVNFNSAHAPKTAALYRTGQRIFAPDDYTLNAIAPYFTLVVALNVGAGERLDADYTY
jgi:hypothetical protein